MKFVLGLVLFAIAAQAALTPVPPATIPPTPTPTPVNAFSYANSGKDWPGLCQTGKAQSPINIETAKTKCVKHGEYDAKQYRIDFHYKRQLNLSMTNNGNTLKVAGDLGYVTVGGCNPCDGEEYYVKQFHFHAPSEHTIDTTPQKDGHYQMELHIVHQKKGSSGLNDLLFVTIQFYLQPDGGFPNWFLDNINWNWAPSIKDQKSQIQGTIDLWKLKESLHGEYYSYKGSLTTPPCTEGVQYFVMKNPLGVTQQQLTVIQSMFQKNPTFAAGNGNNRPVQPLNNREVVWYRRRH